MFGHFTPEQLARIEADNKVYGRRLKMMKTTQGRFLLRIEDFKKEKKSVLIHHFHWLLHNVVIHPLIGFFPVKWTFELHDWSSDKLNLKR